MSKNQRHGAIIIFSLFFGLIVFASLIAIFGEMSSRYHTRSVQSSEYIAEKFDSLRDSEYGSDLPDPNMMSIPEVSSMEIDLNPESRAIHKVPGSRGLYIGYVGDKIGLGKDCEMYNLVNSTMSLHIVLCERKKTKASIIDSKGRSVRMWLTKFENKIIVEARDK